VIGSERHLGRFPDVIPSSSRITCSELIRYGEPGIVASMVAFMALNFRRFLKSHFYFPRPYPLIMFGEPDPKTGRIQHYDYLVKPYYQRPTIANRWGPIAWITWVLGGTLPGDKGPDYKPEGFLFSEIGPDHQYNKGKEFTDAMEAKQKILRPSGCPYSM
jgi:hypothetical protein